MFAATVVDDYDNDNTMTTQGNCAVVSGGKIGQCTKYDNETDWMETPDHSNLDLTDDFTISFWAYAHTLSGGGSDYMVMKKTDDGVTDTSANYMIYVGGSTDKIILNIGGTSFNSNRVFTAGSWHHVVVVFDVVAGAGNETALFLL